MPFTDVFKRMGLDSGDDLNVLFERGDKSVSTSPKTLSLSKKDSLTANFSEILRLDATLYKDSSGNYQEKVGKLTVRQKKSGTAGLKAGKDAFKAIGVVPLQLHTFANNGDAHQQLTLPLQWCMCDTATLTIIINTRISESAQNSEADSDDNSSVTSTPSLQSQVGNTGSSVSSNQRTAANASVPRLTSSVINKPVVPPITSKHSMPPPAPNRTGPPSDEGSTVSWAARKVKNGKAASSVGSDDGSEDGQKTSSGAGTGTGKGGYQNNMGLGSKPASFSVDDWQPDFNGSQSSASVSVKEQPRGSNFNDASRDADDSASYGAETNDNSAKSKLQWSNGKINPNINGNRLNKEAEAEIARLTEEVRGLKYQNVALSAKAAAAATTTTTTSSTRNSAHSGLERDSEIETLKAKITQLTNQHKDTERNLHEERHQKEEKGIENLKLLKEILDLKMSTVPLIKDSEYWKAKCSELKLNLQGYASRLTTIEVLLAEAELSAASGDQPLPQRPLSTGTGSRPPSFSIQPPSLKPTQKPPQVIAQALGRTTSAPLSSSPKQTQREQPSLPAHIPSTTSFPAAPATASTSTSKFSNFVNSNKAAVGPTVTDNKKGATSHYLSSVDLS